MERKPEEVQSLVAEQFSWYETPFSVPIINDQAALISEWQSVLEQEVIVCKYHIICENDVVCVANWKANFTRVPSGEKVELDGIFEFKLDESGKCTEFHQWYCSE